MGQEKKKKLVSKDNFFFLCFVFWVDKDGLPK